MAIISGREIGLSAMASIQRMAPINGRLSIFGDAVPALLYAAGFQINEEPLIAANTASEINGYECTVTRPDGTQITRKFTRSMAKQAALWGRAGPWSQYPERMLQMRARGLAARDGAADVLAGMYLKEEAQDIEAVDITPPDTHDTDEPQSTDLDWLTHNTAFVDHDKRPTAHAFKKDGGGEIWTEISGQINDTDSLEALQKIVDTYNDELLDMPMQWALNTQSHIKERWRELSDDLQT